VVLHCLPAKKQLRCNLRVCVALCYQSNHLPFSRAENDFAAAALNRSCIVIARPRVKLAWNGSYSGIEPYTPHVYFADAVSYLLCRRLLEDDTGAAHFQRVYELLLIFRCCQDYHPSCVSNLPERLEEWPNPRIRRGQVNHQNVSLRVSNDSYDLWTDPRFPD
jgi:hypothetical protein